MRVIILFLKFLQSIKTSISFCEFHVAIKALSFRLSMNGKNFCKNSPSSEIWSWTYHCLFLGFSLICLNLWQYITILISFSLVNINQQAFSLEIRLCWAWYLENKPFHRNLKKKIVDKLYEWKSSHLKNPSDNMLWTDLFYTLNHPTIKKTNWCPKKRINTVESLRDRLARIKMDKKDIFS